MRGRTAQQVWCAPQAPFGVPARSAGTRRRRSVRGTQQGGTCTLWLAPAGRPHPESSWYAMTPAAHTSEEGKVWEESVSGAMNLDTRRRGRTATRTLDGRPA